jgi:hypothetical protein
MAGSRLVGLLENMKELMGMQKFIDSVVPGHIYDDDDKTGKRIIHRTPTWILECVCKDTHGLFQWDRLFFCYFMDHWFQLGVSNTRMSGRDHPEDHRIKFGVHPLCKTYRKNEARNGPGRVYVDATPEDLKQCSDTVEGWRNGNMLGDGLLPWDPEAGKIRAIVHDNAKNHNILTSARAGKGDSLVRHDPENIRAYWSKEHVLVKYEYGKVSKTYKKQADDARTLQTKGYLDWRYLPTYKIFHLPEYQDPASIQTNRWFLVRCRAVQLRLARWWRIVGDCGLEGFKKVKFFPSDTMLRVMRDCYKKEFRQIDYVYLKNLHLENQAAVQEFAGRKGIIHCEIAQRKYLYTWIMSNPSSLLSDSGTFLPAKTPWSRILTNMHLQPTYNVFVVILFEDPPASE